MSDVNSLFKGLNKRKNEAEDCVQSSKTRRTNGEGSKEKAEYDEQEEEEGRFYGDGLDDRQREILEYIDSRDENKDMGPEKYDKAFLSKVLIKFEKAINTNSQLRTKYFSEPMKFFDSEQELYLAIKSLSVLSETDLYNEFIESGSLQSLISLFGHENCDVVGEVVKIINELVDEDNVASDQESIVSLVDAMITNQLDRGILNYLVGLDKASIEEMSACLNLVETLCSFDGVATRFFSMVQPSIVGWLLEKIREKDMSPIKVQCAEVLSVLLLADKQQVTQLLEYDGINKLLLEAAEYRISDPKLNDDEEEYAENIFNILAVAVRYEEGVKEAFVELEGIELIIILLNGSSPKKWAKSRAVTILAELLRGVNGTNIAQNVVTSGALKPLFRIFASEKTSINKLVQNLISIFANLLRWLDLESSERIRLIGKFCEKNYDKLENLVRIRQEVSTRIKQVEVLIAQEQKELEDDEDITPDERLQIETDWEIQRTEAGVELLQNIDLIFAWLILDEDEKLSTKVTMLLMQSDQSSNDIRAALQNQVDELKPVAVMESGSDYDLSNAKREANDWIEMLQVVLDGL